MANLDKMYPDNIYIKNFEELANDHYDTETSLGVFESNHGIKRDNKARAEYLHWLSLKLGDPKILDDQYKGYIKQ